MFNYNYLAFNNCVLNSLSRGAPSTTRPPLRSLLSKHFKRFGNTLNSRPMQFFVEHCVNMSKQVGDFWVSGFPQRSLFTEKCICGKLFIYRASNSLTIHDESKIFGTKPSSLHPQCSYTPVK